MSYGITNRYPERRLPARRGSSVGIGVILLVIILLFGGCFGWRAIYKGSKRSVTTTVTQHERVCESGNSSCKYLVYTDDGTFKLTDSWYFGNHNVSDWYGKLRDGRTYRFDVAGWRFGFTSDYPNIISEPKLQDN